MEEKKWYEIANEKNVNKENAKFVLEQAEKQVKETSDVGNNVVARATTLLTLVSGLLIALFGYGFTQWMYLSAHNSNGVQTVLSTCIYSNIYLFIIALLLTYNLLGKDYAIVGSEPKALFKDTFFNKSKDDDVLIHFYVSELVQYQTRIENNKTMNKKRWKLYHITLLMTTFIPLVIFIIFAIINHR